MIYSGGIFLIFYLIVLDEVGALVVEFGAHDTKIGFAGQDVPRIVCPTSVGSIIQDIDMDNVQSAPSSNVFSQNKRYIIGEQNIGFLKDHMEIENPIESGLITNWDIIENLLQYSLFKMLRLNAKEHPILLAESAFTTTENRQKACQLLFEKFDVPAVFFAKSPVLASFSFGRSTSLVIDSGYSGTNIIPVHDGYILKKGIRRTKLGGDRLNQILYHFLQNKDQFPVIKPRYQIKRTLLNDDENNLQFHVEQLDFPNVTQSYHQYMTNQLLEDIKHLIFRINDSHLDPSLNFSIPPLPYILPDGQNIDIGSYRCSIPELFYQPSYLKNDFINNLFQDDYIQFEGLHKLAFESVNVCDSDIRRELMSNLAIVGGNSLIPGFFERFQKQLRDICSQSYKVKTLQTGSTIERNFGVWIGGSILGSLGTFQQMWFSRSEYAEYGVTHIDKKCP